MRILNLRFKNLNSLAGEWEIDLTHPAYVSDGIFAITGPTGAGKSTILDALSLALYGHTPRLGRVSRGGNEIMSRRRGDCFAEVVLKTQSGRYRSHWSQHRARKKAGAELQAPKHELADADSGIILATGIRGVAEKIEKLTGMDFDRFTRTMLLAQGGFAAFLQAAPDERAPILEQMTGTEIFSFISVRVHERKSIEKKKLEEMQAELKGMSLLSPQEEQEIEAEHDKMILWDSEISRMTESATVAKRWLEDIERLERELSELAKQEKEIETEVRAFQPEQERLRLASLALELSEVYGSLNFIRCEQKKEMATLYQLKESLPECAKTLDGAEKLVKKTEKHRDEKKTEIEKTLPLIKKARELDLIIDQKKAPIEEAKKTVDSLSVRIEALLKTQIRDNEEMRRYREALSELEARLRDSAPDARLAEELAGLREKFEAQKTRKKRLEEKSAQEKLVRKAHDKAIAACSKEAARLEKQKKRFDEIKNKSDDKKNVFGKLLDGREISEWRKEQILLISCKDMLGRGLEAVRVIRDSGKVIAGIEKRQADIKKEEGGLANMIEVKTAEREGIERESDLLEANLIMLKRIKNFEEARRDLQDGEPCPLCGAPDHPYARGNVPVPDKTRQRIDELKTKRRTTDKHIFDLNKKRVELCKESENLSDKKKEQCSIMEKSVDLLEEISLKLPEDYSFDSSDKDIDEKLERFLEECSGRLENVSLIVDKADKTEKEIAKLRDLADKEKEALSAAERRAEKADYEKKNSETQLEKTAKELEGDKNAMDKGLDRLLAEIRIYGIEKLSAENLDEVFEILSRRRELRRADEKEKDQLEKKMAELEQKLLHNKEVLKKADEDLLEKKESLEKILGERETLCRERHNVFGERKTGEEEEKLHKNLDFAEKEFNFARKKFEESDRKLIQLKTEIRETERRTEARQADLRNKEELFLRRLEETGFADEESYRAASLTDKERRLLAEKAEKLSDRRKEIISGKLERQQKLEVERKKEITGRNQEEIRKELEELASKQKEIQQKIGAARERLDENVRLGQVQKKRMDEIEKQGREYSGWLKLHELIGSADGKKYRNFAQGLTFELMIKYANRQLGMMSDRYLLIRDNSMPLELNVIDSYQAGEIRSVKNLSGGESFIVSLALALGLSSMAGMNIRVDSLFLDEGFGSLDEEALDIAMDTLAGLRQDGKLTCVISHVPALKERIAAQIQVIPQSGGKSILKGPGCRMVSSQP